MEVISGEISLLYSIWNVIGSGTVQNLDAGLDLGLDSGLNNGLNNRIIARDSGYSPRKEIAQTKEYVTGCKTSATPSAIFHFSL